MLVTRFGHRPDLVVNDPVVFLARDASNDDRDGFDPMVVDEDQAAQMLGISRRMVFEFRSKGELQYVKLGRLIRYRVSDIQMFLERKRIETNSHASGRQG